MRELALQFLQVMGSRSLQRALGAVTIILLARVLSVEEYGIYGLFVSTATLACSLGSFGLRQSVAYYIGRDQAATPKILAGGLALVAPLTIATTVGAILWLHVTQANTSVSWEAPALCAVFGMMLTYVVQGKNLGWGEIKYFNLYETAPFVITLSGIALVWSMGWKDLNKVVWVAASSYLIVGLMALARVLRHKQGPFVFNKRVAFDLLKNGLPYAVAMSLATANNTASLYLLSMKGMAQAAGYFYMAWQVNNALLNITNALGVVFFSHGTRSKDPKKALQDVARLTSLLMWFMLIAGICGAAVAPWVVPFVLGPRYEPVVIFIQALLMNMSFVSLSRVLYPTLGGLGMPYLSMILLVPALIVNVVLSFFLLDFMGLMGAVVALVTSQLLLAAGYLFVIKSKFGLSPLIFVFPAIADVKKALSKAKSIYTKAQKGDATL